uniref:Signal recognition particle SRP72 subunit RNA-binding domain-containing protein n=1 Tax=Piliocolobus tephrosceles TaxID=591936 RepID=A0A8C9I4H6_9PRIM
MQCGWLSCTSTYHIDWASITTPITGKGLTPRPFGQSQHWTYTSMASSPASSHSATCLSLSPMNHFSIPETFNNPSKQNPWENQPQLCEIKSYPEKAKALSKHLPSSDSMSLKVDVEALENSPDNPERWLPMRERSYYRGRKKGKKKDQIGKGTQGATAGASSELDASKTVSSPPTSPRPGSAATVSASTSNIIPPRHQKPAGAPATKKKQQQKKKKGGKGGW